MNFKLMILFSIFILLIFVSGYIIGLVVTNWNFFFYNSVERSLNIYENLINTCEVFGE